MNSKIQYLNPQPDIKLGYLLYIPSNIKDARILLWGHGSTQDNLDYNDIHIALEREVMNIAGDCDKLNLVCIMPVLPKSYEHYKYPELKFDSQIMSKEVMYGKFSLENANYNRPDLEILKIINSVKENLKTSGISVKDKIIIGGVSAGANMANRFSVLYPELIDCSLLLLSGIFTYPVNDLDKVALNYPFGINDIDSLINKSFDLESFKIIKQFIYVGEQDNNPRNDIARFEFIAEKEKENISKVIGMDSVTRTRKYAEYLRSLGIEVELYIEKDLGHNVNGKVMDTTFDYLKNILGRS